MKLFEVWMYVTPCFVMLSLAVHPYVLQGLKFDVELPKGYYDL